MKNNEKPTGLTLAEVMQAIAGGKTADDFEVIWGTYHMWFELSDPVVGSYVYESDPVFRLKVKTREINGFTVPIAMTVEPEEDTAYWFIKFTEKELVSQSRWDGYNIDLMLLKIGVCFSTKEAAMANAKAMLGVDPEGS